MSTAAGSNANHWTSFPVTSIRLKLSPNCSVVCKLEYPLSTMSQAVYMWLHECRWAQLYLALSAVICVFPSKLEVFCFESSDAFRLDYRLTWHSSDEGRNCQEQGAVTNPRQSQPGPALLHMRLCNVWFCVHNVLHFRDCQLHLTAWGR
jgi:hypothetical protein